MASSTRPHCPIIQHPMVLWNVRYRPYKKGLRKVTEGTLDIQLSKVLFTNQVTPDATTGVSPAELLLHYQPHTRLDLLFSQIADRVENQQSRQKKLHDRTAQQRDFAQGQAVYLVRLKLNHNYSHRFPNSHDITQCKKDELQNDFSSHLLH